MVGRERKEIGEGERRGGKGGREGELIYTAGRNSRKAFTKNLASNMDAEFSVVGVQRVHL